LYTDPYYSGNGYGIKTDIASFTSISYEISMNDSISSIMIHRE
jgi:hypothetical protein